MSITKQTFVDKVVVNPYHVAMARPIKDPDRIPTKERILNRAIELFSSNGFSGTSIRNIARACSLNEASLYNYFSGKKKILEAIIDMFTSTMVLPETEEEAGPIPYPDSEWDPVGATILEGARRFFSKADDRMMKIWRILMIEQYAYPEAADTVRDMVLEAPKHYFRTLLAQLAQAGQIKAQADTAGAANVLAALFFEFSFRSNLDTAWDNQKKATRDELQSGIDFILSALKAD